MKAQADQRLSQQVRQGQQVVEHQLPLFGLINIKNRMMAGMFGSTVLFCII